jgi:hypothetical protein
VAGFAIAALFAAEPATAAFNPDSVVDGSDVDGAVLENGEFKTDAPDARPAFAGSDALNPESKQPRQKNLP